MRSVKDIFRSYAVFDAEGRHVNGTDKESNHHYGDAYEAIFARYTGPPIAATPWHPELLKPEISIGRIAVKLMMEIGVADGSSLLAWQEVFPNATVVGMDIHSAAKWTGEFHLGDQRFQQDCERAAAGRLFDVIVEDAVHTVDNTLLTLFWLWPFVAPGGLYIVEEFASIHGCKKNLETIGASIVDTVGPSGGSEPLVVLRKPA